MVREISIDFYVLECLYVLNFVKYFFNIHEDYHLLFLLMPINMLYDISGFPNNKLAFCLSLFGLL